MVAKFYFTRLGRSCYKPELELNFKKPNFNQTIRRKWRQCFFVSGFVILKRANEQTRKSELWMQRQAWSQNFSIADPKQVGVPDRARFYSDRPASQIAMLGLKSRARFMVMSSGSLVWVPIPIQISTHFKWAQLSSRFRFWFNKRVFEASMANYKSAERQLSLSLSFKWRQNTGESLYFVRTKWGLSRKELENCQRPFSWLNWFSSVRFGSAGWVAVGSSSFGLGVWVLAPKLDFIGRVGVQLNSSMKSARWNDKKKKEEEE